MVRLIGLYQLHPNKLYRIGSLDQLSACARELLYNDFE